jgi:hypothetical protein
VTNYMLDLATHIVNQKAGSFEPEKSSSSTRSAPASRSCRRIGRRRSTASTSWRRCVGAWARKRTRRKRAKAPRSRRRRGPDRRRQGQRSRRQGRAQVSLTPIAGPLSSLGELSRICRPVEPSCASHVVPDDGTPSKRERARMHLSNSQHSAEQAMVLLVEDEDLLREMLEDTLSEAGFGS